MADVLSKQISWILIHRRFDGQQTEVWVQLDNNAGHVKWYSPSGPGETFDVLLASGFLDRSYLWIQPESPYSQVDGKYEEYYLEKMGAVSFPRAPVYMATLEFEGIVNWGGTIEALETPRDRVR